MIHPLVQLASPYLLVSVPPISFEASTSTATSTGSQHAKFLLMKSAPGTAGKMKKKGLVDQKPRLIVLLKSKRPCLAFRSFFKKTGTKKTVPAN